MNVSVDQVSPVKEIIEPVNRYFHNPIAASIVEALKRHLGYSQSSNLCFGFCRASLSVYF